MKVSGFTFVRNAIKYDYPVVEAITSVLPICDEFVVAVGHSDDNTLDLIRSIPSEKIRIIETVWDELSNANGSVYASETNKAFQAISADSDWAFYIQGDEVVHEQDLGKIKDAMIRFKDDKKVDGLLFKYRHFYGSYDYVGVSNRWYKYEIRVIRNDKSFYSYRDAQGFRKGNNEKLNVKAVDAYIHHYGWVKDPAIMHQKLKNITQNIYSGMSMETFGVQANEFAYEKFVTQLGRYTGTHPAVMQDRIKRLNWKFESDISFSRPTMKDRVKKILLMIGIDTNYKNYRLLR